MYYGSFYFSNDVLHYSLLGVILSLLVCGQLYEGLRFLHQMPFLVGLLVQTVLYFSMHNSFKFVIIMNAVATALLLLSALVLVLFGDSDFAKITLTGPYQVGY